MLFLISGRVGPPESLAIQASAASRGGRDQRAHKRRNFLLSEHRTRNHWPYQWFHRRGQWALSLQEGREQGTPHAQLEMRGISPVICSREGEASIISFPIRFFWTGQSNKGACRRYTKKKTRSTNQIQKQRNNSYKQIDKFNSNKAELQQQKDIAAQRLARLLWSILVSSSNLVTLIKRQYITCREGSNPYYPCKRCSRSHHWVSYKYPSVLHLLSSTMRLLSQPATATVSIWWIPAQQLSSSGQGDLGASGRRIVPSETLTHMRKVFIFFVWNLRRWMLWSMYADHATIYNSINYLLPTEALPFSSASWPSSVRWA